MEKRFLKRFFIGLGAFLGMIILIVVIFDPFYHYHGPLGNLKAVLEERDYEVAGTLDHFDYEAIILGTSIAENYNTNQFLENFGMQTIKAIRASGSNADLLYYLDRAYQSQDVKRVFYFVDYYSLGSPLETTFASADTNYITNRNPLDDIEYVLNKDVLLKKIPIQLAYSYVLPYDEGEAYSWYATKEFSRQAILSRYQPREDFLEMESIEKMDEIYYQNIELLYEKILAHPETEFDIVFSPASALWWDDAYRGGKAEQYLYLVYYITEKLQACENAKVYFYQAEDVAFELEQFMDTVHFSEAVNRDICDKLAEDTGRITIENAEEKLRMMYDRVEEFATQGIKEYYPDVTVR
ncbi:MAG: hypothetical protein IKJ39_09165 [Lachnospiraceae bacterium]|nr:hypothetical protein [Lachnospiraceae bacterium]